MGYEFIIEDRIPVVVYDVSIEDMNERKMKAKTYESIKKACQVLKISYNSMKRSITNRTRIYSPALDKNVAIRYKK